MSAQHLASSWEADGQYNPFAADVRHRINEFTQN
jgi:hypothetical protein